VKRFVVVSVLLLAFAACKPPKVQQAGCREDKDCGDPASAYRCETQTGVCYCRTNDACQPREFCNPAGFCQDRSGCEKNADCLDESLFCDTTSGTCLGKGRCSIDLQCELGQVCDTVKATCVPGCRSSGDCPGTSCRCGDVPCVCTGTTQAEVAACTVGECDPNFCANDSFCKFGETCGAMPDAGMVRNTCYSDYDQNRKPYCDNCAFGGGTSVCGTGANYCLIDTAHPGNFYCGTDCSGGESCPRGYGCQDVIVVFTQWACTKANPSCPANAALPCTMDTDCKRGGYCAKNPGSATGLCAGKCGIDEGDTTGFCTCQVDSDCAQETCSGGECSISRKKCVDEKDCRPIRCVDFQGGGGCLIGQNCAPTNGLSCLEVR
jgi:hypothetical protein